MRVPRPSSAEAARLARGAARRIGRRLLAFGERSSPNDVLAWYHEILAHPHGTRWADLTDEDRRDAVDAQWVIPPFGPGSGGHLNIFRFVRLLAERGVRQRVVVVGPHGWDDAPSCAAAIDQWYGTLPASVGLDLEGFVPAATTLATGWQTAFAVAEFGSSAQRVYFIQDDEREFYPASVERMLAERTYGLGLVPVTAGPWLADHLAPMFHHPATVLSFGCDDPMLLADRSSVLPAVADTVRVLFYSRHTSPRRLFAIGVAALETVCDRRADVEVVFVGGDVGEFSVPFRHHDLGHLHPSQLHSLYGGVDVALVLSATNLSLLPAELAAAGCPVVMNDGPNTRWLLDDDIAEYAPANPAGLATALLGLLDAPDELDARRARCLEWASGQRWADQADVLAQVLERPA